MLLQSEVSLWHDRLHLALRWVLRWRGGRLPSNLLELVGGRFVDGLFHLIFNLLLLRDAQGPGPSLEREFERTLLDFLLVICLLLLRALLQYLRQGWLRRYVPLHKVRRFLSLHRRLGLWCTWLPVWT